jgi:protein O-GlcNAc transferase
MNRHQRRAAAKHGNAQGGSAAAPSGVKELLAVGVRHHQAGQLPEAEKIYRRALELQPDQPDALHLLGVLAIQAGCHDVATELIGRAVRLNAANPGYHANLALALQHQGRFDEALANFDRALALKPDYAEAFHHRGRLLEQRGRFDDALDSYQRAVALNPALAEAWLDCGNVCAALGRHEEALAAYHHALDVNPDLAGAWVGRGNVLCGLERHDEALGCYAMALACDSTLASAWLGRGNALSAQKRLGDALAAYDSALALDPDMAGAWLGRGNVLRELSRADDAIAAYDAALRRDPELAEAYLGRGNVLSELKRDEEALAAYQMAIAVRPDFAEAWLGRGNVLREARRFIEALAAYDRALQLKPQLPGLQGARLKAKMQVCDWRDFDAERAQLIASLRQGRIVQPFDLLSISASAGEQYQCARSFSERNWPPAAGVQVPRSRPAHDRIRLTYMSADFRQHPMSFLMAEIFERHDRSRFEVTAISIGPDDGSPMRRRLETAFAQFIDARAFTDERIASLIEESGIDILVDLMGYTKGARTAVVARRPAPIQVNYLGFPGTMGTPHIDYVIADRIVIPDAQRARFAERIAYLPFSYYPNGREPHGDKAVARADVGLPDEAFVFCCFNNSFKILPDVFDSWMRILSEVEGSVLWLLEDNEMASANLRKEAVARGVAAERLIFAGRATHADHLARHRCADLFIDTLPYNAHTTALDALWEGVPVLTRAGETFAGRVAASLLTALDLSELIAQTSEDYQRLAIELARNPLRLAALKQKLRDNRLAAPLFDTALFTGHIEKAYAMMVERHRAGLGPDDLVV